MKHILTSISLLTIFALTASAQDSTSRKSIDQSLPDLVVKTIDGENVNLKDLADGESITIISFWATWCKPCIKELNNLSTILEEWQEEYPVKLVTISVDDSRNVSKVKPFAAGRGWDFDILLDPNGDVQRALNVSNPPTTMLVDQNGKVAYIHAGYQEGDEYELEKYITKLSKK